MKTDHRQREQLDLFTWADSKPSNVINAKARFEAKVMAFVVGIINGQLPPTRDGKVIAPQFRRDLDRGAA